MVLLSLGIDSDCALALLGSANMIASGAVPADLLFVYGTLHPDRAPAAILRVVRQLEPLGAGAVHGRLVRFATYPALRLNRAGQEVHGDVFRVPESLWPALDDYEGCVPGHPGRSLFMRELTAVQMVDGSQRICWVYLYARDFNSHKTGARELP